MNTKIKYNCDRCRHASVCKYRNSALKLDDIKLELSDPFSILVECTYYDDIQLISITNLDKTCSDSISTSDSLLGRSQFVDSIESRRK